MINLIDLKNWLDINHNSVNTSNNYFKQIKGFLTYTNGEISQELLNKYITEKMEKGQSKNSLNIFFASIKKLCVYSKITLEIPKIKKVNIENKEYFTEKEFNDEIIKPVGMIFQDPEKIETLFMLLFYTGIRVSEAINLKIEDINFEKEQFNIKETKGKKDRIIPFIESKLTKKLVSYIGERKEGKLFDISSEQTVRDHFNKVKIENQIKKEIHPHIMRHSFTNHVLSLGLPETVIQKLLGHKKLETTKGYINVDLRAIEDFCKKIKR